MATLSIQTKRVKELESILSAPDDGLILCHDGKGLKAITVKNFKSDLNALIDKVGHDNAGTHNSIYRGKNLGNSVTVEQYATIKEGKFTDMYIGDYWIAGGINWRIASFDYYMNSGNSTIIKDHHAVIVPDVTISESKLKNTADVTGGYANALSRSTCNPTLINSKSNNIFDNHYMVKDLCLTTGQSTTAWTTGCSVEQMTEENVFGSTRYGVAIPELDSKQYPLFQFRPDLIQTSEWYWLRNTASGTAFACVLGNGLSSVYNADTSIGIRPAFCIKG